MKIKIYLFFCQKLFSIFKKNVITILVIQWVVVNMRNSDLKNIMLKKYLLKKLKFDFMGYPFKNINSLSFHHVVVSRCECEKNGFDTGYYLWNLVLLNRKTSHDYLHIIEDYDYDMFEDINSELFDMIVKEQVTIENIMYINSILESFEREYCGHTRNGHPLIKDAYTHRIILYKDIFK